MLEWLGKEALAKKSLAQKLPAPQEEREQQLLPTEIGKAAQ